MKKYNLNFLNLGLSFGIFLLGPSVHASELTTIKCVTPRDSHTFIISINNQNRSLASVDDSSYHYSVTRSGVKYHLYINNMNQFSETEDYLMASSSQIHQIIYPVKCQKN